MGGKSMRWTDGFIAVDWGTTNRRAYLIDSSGKRSDEFEDAKGVLSIPDGGFPAAVKTDSSFSWEGGGGLDLTHSQRWAIRAIQLDYAQTKFLGNLSQANYRLSVGFVYRFAPRK